MILNWYREVNPCALFRILSLLESIFLYHCPLSKQLYIPSSTLHLRPRQIELITPINLITHMWLLLGGGIYIMSSNTTFGKTRSSSETHMAPRYLWLQNLPHILHLLL